MAPVTKSWEDLLGNAPLATDTSDLLETSARVPSGSAWFAGQSEAVQRDILGPAKYEAWQSGDLKLADLIGHQSDPEWGPSMYEKSLRELGLNAQDYLQRIPFDVGGEAGGAVAVEAPSAGQWPEGVEVLQRTDDGLVLLRTEVGDVWAYEDASRDGLKRTLDELRAADEPKWAAIDQTLADLRGEQP